MNSSALFSMVLGLQSPWQVDDVSFSAAASGRRELHFVRGSRFLGGMGVTRPVHDTVEREWQYLNFFEHHPLRWSRGYRNTGNYINMIYFLCGKLKFDYPL